MKASLVMKKGWKKKVSLLHRNYHDKKYNKWNDDEAMKMIYMNCIA